jgi:hypothetical protein
MSKINNMLVLTIDGTPALLNNTGRIAVTIKGSHTDIQGKLY